MLSAELDRYQILKKIGAGGMGVVYLARDTELGRDVAIKQLQETFSDDVARFKREAKLLAKLNHPNIVHIYDFIYRGQITRTLGLDARASLVMEYIEGQPLSLYLNNGHYTHYQAMVWLTEICLGLAAAHNQKVIHRDLKAENILVTRDHRIKITDFGIARHINATQNYSSQMLGSFSAISPEQIWNEKLTEKADLFALGLLAYQLFCGRHPFGYSGAPAELIHNTCYIDPTAPIAINSKIEKPLNQLILNLLNKNPEQRPDSAQSVGLELDNLIKNSVPDSTPTSTVAINKIIQIKGSKSRIANALNCTFLPVVRLNRWSFITTLTLLLAVIGMLIHFKLNKQPYTRYVTLLPPVFSQSMQVNMEQYAHVAVPITNGLEQALISSADHNLIPFRDISKDEQDMLVFENLSGVDYAIATKIACVSHRCEIGLKLIDASSRAIVKQIHWPILVDESLNSYLVSQEKIASLLGITLSAKKTGITEALYRDFVSLYSSFYQSPADFPIMLNRCDELIQRAPFFTPLYRLYASIGFHGFYQTKDASYLDRVNEMLQQAGQRLPERYALLTQAEIFIAKSDYRSAKAMLKPLADAQLSRDNILFLEAKIAYKQGRYARSEQAVEKAINLRPLSKYYKWLVLAQWQVGHYQRARMSITKMLAIRPADEFALGMLGSVALFEGKLDEAIRVYSDLATSHNNGQNLSDLGLVHYLNRDFQKAKHYFSQALEGAKENATYLLNLADAESMLGNIETANRLYHRILAMENETQMQRLEGKLTLAQAFVNLDDNKRALSLMQSLLEQHPSSANVLFTASLVYVLAGETQSSLIYFERALKAGVGGVWFNLPAFAPLCKGKVFANHSRAWGEKSVCMALDAAQ